MLLLVALNTMFIIIMSILLIFINNINLISVSFKIFFLGFFGELEFLLSIWNLMFLLLVLLISLSVMFFSLSYMNNLKLNSFMFLYLAFVFSMSWLILNNNFYWMMLGWDGPGVVSFLLIVYYSNVESISNGLFTLFQNRLGDLFFVLFLVQLLNLTMSTSLMMKWIIILMILGSCVKSAQFPFNSWLLAAMSAPTPISSLVHSSTLVVAGVYIMIQYSYCLNSFLGVLKLISLLTLLISSWGLLNEMDMKKLIAFSTMSHVSLMMFLYSQKLFKLVYFHLSMHAMFKSLMFMAFGFLMLSSFHSQDKRLISYNYMNPHMLMIYYFSCMCLMGLPFLTGFFSKDFIIEKLLENSYNLMDVFLLLLFLGISIYYSMTLLKLNFNVGTQMIVEKQFVGGISLFLMFFLNIFLVNIYISLVFSVSLELSSFKFFIYLIMFLFLLLNLVVSLNYKLTNYSKILSMIEMKSINFYMLDLYVYSSMYDFVKIVNSLSNIKLILMSNWWVMILFVYLI